MNAWQWLRRWSQENLAMGEDWGELALLIGLVLFVAALSWLVIAGTA